jgi:hypothetical protein
MTEEPKEKKTGPIPRRLRFRDRVYFRVALATPIALAIIFAPDDWLRFVVALSFMLNFLSIEILIEKIRSL